MSPHAFARDERAGAFVPVGPPKEAEFERIPIWSRTVRDRFSGAIAEVEAELARRRGGGA